MGVVTSKSKRDAKSERKARQSKVGKRTSSTSKHSMLMTALEDAQWNLHNGDGAGTVINGKDASRKAEHGDTTRAWTDVEECGGLEEIRHGTVKVVGQAPVDETQQRTSCGELKIYDVDPEAEMKMTLPAISGGRPEAAVVRVTGDVTDGTSKKDDFITTADDDVTGKRTVTMSLPTLPEVLRNRVRIPTGGITTTGILSSLPSKVPHGDGLPDVECVARGIERKTSIVDGAHLARCQTLRAAELQEKSFGNSSQNRNSDVIGFAKTTNLCPFPGSYACSYGCSFPPSCPALAGDFLRRLPTGKDGFVESGAADADLFLSDRSSYGAKGYTWVLMASADAGDVDAPHPVSVQDSHPMKVTLMEPLLKKPTEKIRDPGTWLVEEEEEQLEEKKKEQTKEEMKADMEVDKLAEEMIAPTEEQETKQTAEKTKYPYADEVSEEKPTQQMADQPDRIDPRQKLYSKACPLGDYTIPPQNNLEESGTPQWMEAADEEDGTEEDSDETLTEEVAKEDVADRPEELGDIESWYRYEVALHCTQHPSTTLRSTSSRNSGDAEAGLHGNDTHGNTEQSGKVLVGICNHCNHGDAAHLRGDAEQSSEKVTGVPGDCIHSDAELDANMGDALLDHEDAGCENTGHSTGQEEVLNGSCSVRSTSVTIPENETLETFADPRLECSSIGNGSRNEVATWSDSEVTGNDSDIAWSDAWVTWSDVQAKDNDGGGRGGGKGGEGGKGGGRGKGGEGGKGGGRGKGGGGKGGEGRRGRRRGRTEAVDFFDQTKPSKDLPLP